MKETHYLTVTVQEGNRFEVFLPNLAVGETVEVIVIVPSIDHTALIKLPLEKRSIIMEKQAESMVKYYQENTDWQEWVNLDTEESYDN